MTNPDSYEIRPFQCLCCGNCCRGEGYVRISPEDSRRIAEYLGMDEDAFKAAYTRRPEIASQADNGDTWLIDKPGPEQECIFLENNKCRIHAVKPSQCAGFPMRWRTPDIMAYCKGMRQ